MISEKRISSLLEKRFLFLVNERFSVFRAGVNLNKFNRFWSILIAFFHWFVLVLMVKMSLTIANSTIKRATCQAWENNLGFTQKSNKFSVYVDIMQKTWYHYSGISEIAERRCKKP